MTIVTFPTTFARVNSFYATETPQFAQSMFDFLVEAQSRASRPAIVQPFMLSKTAKFEADKKLMTDFAQDSTQDYLPSHFYPQFLFRPRYSC